LFTTAHIALTGGLTGALAGLFAAWRLRGGHRILESVLIGALSAGAVFLLRKSANMPQLNDDGLQGFSANDWLAPTVTFMVLGLYGAVRPQSESRRYEQTRAAATVIAFVITVVAI
jgi:hypothetical protein